MKQYNRLSKKVIVDKNGHKRTVYVKRDEGMGISRKDMPQITKENTEKFLQYLEKKGVSFEKKEMDVKKLKPTQMDISHDQVKQMMDRAKETGDTQWLRRTVIVSKDNYILDGHHRWASLNQMDGKQNIKSIQVNVSIKRLLELANKFPLREKRTIEESKQNINKGM